MNKYIKLAIDLQIVILLTIYSALLFFIQLFVPFKYRCKNIKGQLCLVTGSGNGIGKLMAKKFAKHGARLILVDVDEKENQRTEKEILAGGGFAKAFKCDLSRREEIYLLAKEVNICCCYVLYFKNHEIFCLF